MKISFFAVVAAAATIGAPAPSVAQGSAARPDAAASRELAGLREENAAMIGRLLGDDKAARTVRISFMGKGRAAPADFREPKDDPATGPGKPVAGFVAFNPESGNEYMIEIPADLLRRVGEAAEKRGLNNPGTNEPAAPERPPTAPRPGAWNDGSGASLFQQASWSGGVDNRQRLSSLTQGTDRWVWRAIADLGGCTATMVGPRHAITAGHCIYNRQKAAWNAGFKVTPGRAGANFNYGQATVPSAPFTWYFTPAGFRAASPSGGTGQYDIGILVLPQRLGDKTSWMGWWHGSDSYLQSTSVYNRGFPVCSGSETDGTPRTDDPGDTGSSVVCVASHLYGDPSTCSVGGFSASDGMGWTRRFNHSCDASAGQSGSPLYLFRDNTPYVTGVHTTSTCGKNGNTAKCGASDTRPLVATRMTQEYSDWMSYFRAWKP